MNRSYLIPANSKKSLLKLGIFNNLDLGIFLTGLGLSFIMLVILPIEKFSIAMLAIAPGCFGTFLIIPVPNYHNVRTAIRIAWNFYTTRQKYIWKGWCFSSDEETDKK